MTDMFKDVKLSDWGIGDYALHGNRKVRIVDVNLLEKKRQVAWQEYGEKGETRQWVSVEDLREIKAAGTPIPPKVEPSLAAAAAALAAEDEAMNAMPNVPAGYEVVRYIPPSPGEGGEIWLKPPPGSGVVTDIAQREIDLAKERDELLAKVERLEREKNALVEDYDGKLKFQLERANELVDERDKIKRESALRIAQLRTALGAMPDNDDMDYLEHLLMHTMAELRGQIGDLKAQAQPQPTTRRKNETKIITLHVGLASTNMELGRYIDELDAEGWEIAYEEYQQGVGEHGSTYFARLIRPAQDPISPPQDEARAAVTVDDINALDSDPAPEVADNSVAMLWRSEDEWPDPDNGDEVDLDEVDEEEPELVPEMLIVGLDDEPDWKKRKTLRRVSA